MEARLSPRFVFPRRESLWLVLVAIFVSVLLATASADAASHQTPNFTISAPTPQLAQEIGNSAEHWRKILAVEWIGKEMPKWSKPCPIRARVAPRLGAGGATSFVFDRGEVFGWEMNIQGSCERLLDSVLPHEVTHTIFACYFRQPLPRWADEGACTTVEHPSEIAKQERMLIQFLKQGRGIPFDQMFAMKDYPKDVMPLYSQGHSLAQMLIESRGKKAFLNFLTDGMQDENWPRAVREHYGKRNLAELQYAWLGWVKNGRPQLGPEAGIQVAAANAARGAQPIYRGQSPDPIASKPIAAAPIASTPVVKGDSVYARLAARAKHDRRGALRR